MLLPKSSYPLPLLFPQVHSLQLPLFNSDSDSDNEVVQSCPTLCDPVDCSLPGSSLHGILQARILERVTISFSRGSSQPRDRTQVSHIGGRCFNLWATREALFKSALKKRKRNHGDERYLFFISFCFSKMFCLSWLNKIKIWQFYARREVSRSKILKLLLESHWDIWK